MPAFSSASSKHFESWARAARLNKIILLVWLSRMFSLSGSHVVDLCSSRLECPCILPANTKQNKFCYVSKIKSYSAPVASSVFPNFVPNYVGLVLKAPGFHYLQA